MSDFIRILVDGLDTLNYTARLKVPLPLLHWLTENLPAAREGAQVVRNIAGEAFTLSPGGRGYRWLLRGDSCTLAITDSAEMPAIKVELGARPLWQAGQRAAYERSRAVVHELLQLNGEGWAAHVSRADFAVDFQGWRPDGMAIVAMVTRARVREDYSKHGACRCGARYYLGARRCDACGELRADVPAKDEPLKTEIVVKKGRNKGKRIEVGVGPMRTGEELAQERFYRGRHFTGYRWGSGKTLLGRMYDKTYETRTKSPEKSWFFELWKQAVGYDPTENVWRFEIQCRREFLKELKIPGFGTVDTVDDLLEHAGAIWQYLCGRPPRCAGCQQQLADERPRCFRCAPDTEIETPVRGWMRLHDRGRSNAKSPRNWPLHVVWRALRAHPFRASATAAPALREVRDAASLDLLSDMIHGCLSTVASLRDVRSAAELELGRPADCDELIAHALVAARQNRKDRDRMLAEKPGAEKPPTFTERVEQKDAARWRASTAPPNPFAWTTHLARALWRERNPRARLALRKGL